MNPSPDADRVLLAHMRDCLDRTLRDLHDLKIKSFVPIVVRRGGA